MSAVALTRHHGLVPIIITVMLLRVLAQGGDDLDDFMQQALEKKAADWARLQDFGFQEEVVLKLEGPLEAPVANFRRIYAWSFLGGVLTRTLQDADGVTLTDQEQQESAKQWNDAREKDPGPFSRENFFTFKFEPGRYLLAGKEQCNGREVLVIEYYPKKLFQEDEESDPETEDVDRQIADGLEKTSLVRFWVLPEERQIVRMLFENVGLDFMPYRWLIRVDGIRAELTMDQPFPGLWFPAEISAEGSVSTASATFSILFQRRFSDYREADVTIDLHYDGPESENAQTPE